MQKLVLDTNVVLDLFVFDDALARTLKARLFAAEVLWVATHAMRDELERVLGYANIAARLTLMNGNAAQVLACFDGHAQLVEAAEPAVVQCADPDDQMFIDLAVQQQCMLVSKDAAVLVLKERLAALQVHVTDSLS